jgi:hypothetical protein
LLNIPLSRKLKSCQIVRGEIVHWKKIVVSSLILSMLLLTSTYGAGVRATSEERRSVYEIDSLGLKVNIVAPYLADPGENITVTFNVTSATSSDIDVEYIHVSIHGMRNETEEFSLPLLDIYINKVPYQVDHLVTIPNDTCPGLLYGVIEWGEWSVQFPGGMKVTIENPPLAGFVVTYVKNMKLQEAQAAYDSLLANYTKMENYQSDLGSTRNVMYILVATTVVSAATVFIILLRRPKRPWT